jgi:hypothetical protein
MLPLMRIPKGMEERAAALIVAVSGLIAAYPNDRYL